VTGVFWYNVGVWGEEVLMSPIFGTSTIYSHPLLLVMLYNNFGLFLIGI
jgi:hypothetical protein